MNFDPSQIEIRPHHCARLWQSCDYHANGVHLFHERTYFPHNVFKPVTSEQWLDGGGTLAEISALAAKHGGKAVAEFYAPEGANSYFLAFNDNDKALAFCQSPDFDALCLTAQKLAEV